MCYTNCNRTFLLLGSNYSVRRARVRHPGGRPDCDAAGARPARQTQIPAYHHQ